MELTPKNHRAIHFILLAINVIGIILLTIAIIFTFNQKATKSDQESTNESKPEQCPKYSPATFDTPTDWSGTYINPKGIVAVLHPIDNTFACFGALVHESVVLISHKCLREFYFYVSGFKILLYDESVTSLFNVTGDQYRHVTSYQVSNLDFLVLLFLDTKFNVDKRELCVLPQEIDDQCDISGANTTLLRYDFKLIQSDVAIMSQNNYSTCFFDYFRDGTHFCAESHGNALSYLTSNLF